MAKVVLYNKLLHPVGQELLEKYVDVQVVHSDAPRSEQEEAFQDADGIIVRTPGIVDKHIIELASRLKVVASNGTGTDHIDIKSASDAGVAVVHNPGINALPVAEHVVGLMLSLTRKITESDEQLRKHGWNSRDAFLEENVGYELTGKTVGIIGMGFIGQKVAELCRTGFQNKIIGYDPVVNNEVFQANRVERYLDLYELCRDADFITLHIPYLPATHHLIGEKALNAMKTTGFLINCARGGVVDSEALYHFLKDKKIAGAGLDVFEPEPPKEDEKLFTLDNVIVTPHIAGITDETNQKLSLSAAKQVLQVLEKKKPAHMVNEEVWEKTLERIEKTKNK